MQQILLISYVLVDTMNLTAGILRVLGIRKHSETINRNIAMHSNGAIPKTKAPNAHFYTSYNDILVSSVKCI